MKNTVDNRGALNVEFTPVNANHQVRIGQGAEPMADDDAGAVCEQAIDLPDHAQFHASVLNWIMIYNIHFIDRRIQPHASSNQNYFISRREKIIREKHKKSQDTGAIT